MKLFFTYPKNSIEQEVKFEPDVINHENGNIDLSLKKHWLYSLDANLHPVTAMMQLQFKKNDYVGLFVKDIDLNCYHLRLDCENSILRALVEQEQYEAVYNYVSNILCSPALSVIELLSKNHREFEDKELDYFYGYIDAMFDSGFIKADFKERLEGMAYQVHIKSVNMFKSLA